MARSVETPWNPATTATLPPSSASRRRSLRISRILALRWAVSVTIPAWEPVNDTAASPWSMMAMQSSAIEMRSPEVSSMSISRAVGSPETSWARRSRSSVVLPMAETTTTTSSPARRVRTMCSATARMRSGSATDVPPNFCTSRLTTSHSTGGPRPILGPDSPSVDSPAVPKATKRERQRHNRDARREAMLAEEKKRKRMRTIRNLALLLIPLVILFVVLQLTKSDDSKSSSSSKPAPTNFATTCDSSLPAKAAKTDGAEAGHGHRHLEAVHRGAPHHRGRHPDRPRRQDRAEGRQQLRVPGLPGLSTTAPPSTGSSPTSSTRAATRRATAPAAPATRCPTSRRPTATPRVPWRWRRARRRAARSSSSW